LLVLVANHSQYRAFINTLANSISVADKAWSRQARNHFFLRKGRVAEQICPFIPSFFNFRTLISLIRRRHQHYSVLRRTTKIIIAVVALLVIARLLLPYFVLRYVNKSLADMSGYTGHVEDIDIQLIRGAYQLDDLRIRKVNGKIKEPFLYIPKTDLSVEWKSLFKGKLVSEVECYEPEINFAFSESDASSQTGEEVDWTVYLKKLLPININRFAVIDGKVNLTSLVTQPRADLSLQHFQGEIRNIRNVNEEKKTLPSPVTASGDVKG
jgi:hypothetical protein